MDLCEFLWWAPNLSWTLLPTSDRTTFGDRGCTDKSKTWPFLPQPSCRPDNVARMRRNLWLPTKVGSSNGAITARDNAERCTFLPRHEALLPCMWHNIALYCPKHSLPVSGARWWKEVSRKHSNGLSNCFRKPTRGRGGKLVSSLSDSGHGRFNIRINYDRRRGKEMTPVQRTMMDLLLKVIFKGKY